MAAARRPHIDEGEEKGEEDDVAMQVDGQVCLLPDRSLIWYAEKCHRRRKSRRHWYRTARTAALCNRLMSKTSSKKCSIQNRSICNWTVNRAMVFVQRFQKMFDQECKSNSMIQVSREHGMVRLTERLDDLFRVVSSVLVPESTVVERHESSKLPLYHRISCCLTWQSQYKSMRLRYLIPGRKTSTRSPHSPSLIGSPIRSEMSPPKVRKYLHLRGDLRDKLSRLRTTMRSSNREGARARSKPAKNLVSAAIRQRTSQWSLARVVSDGSICLVLGESRNWSFP